MLPLPFGLDLLEQFRVGPFKIVSKFQPCAQSFGIHLKPPSQFLCGRIVKEGNLLIEIWHDQLVDQFLIPRHTAQSPADNRFVVAQRGERLQVEQLDAPGLQHRGKVAGAVVGRENKRMQQRYLTGIERAPKLRGFSFLLRAVNLVALDSVTQRSLDRRQDSVAPFCVLLTLLIIVEPERSVNADEYQEQLRHPTAETRETRMFFGCLTHV